jgi:hypothetical protein
MISRYVIDGKAILEAGDRQPHILAYLAPDEREKASLADKLHLDETTYVRVDPDEVARLEDGRARIPALKSAARRVVKLIESSTRGAGTNGNVLAFAMSAGPAHRRESSATRRTGRMLGSCPVGALRQPPGRSQLSSELKPRSRSDGEPHL